MLKATDNSYLILAALFLHWTLVVIVLFGLVVVGFEYIVHSHDKNNDIYRCINISGKQYCEFTLEDQEKYRFKDG